MATLCCWGEQRALLILGPVFCNPRYALGRCNETF